MQLGEYSPQPGKYQTDHRTVYVWMIRWPFFRRLELPRVIDRLSRNYLRTQSLSMNEVEGFHERWSVSAQIEEPCEMISKVKRNFVDCLRSFDESVLSRRWDVKH